MTKRLVNIDDDVLEDAKRALGTTTLKDTVNTSLRDTVRTARRHAVTRNDLQRIGKRLEDLRDPEVMAKAWE